MVNGLNINVDEEDFKSRPTVDQNWMIYKAVEKIDRNGCQWGKKSHKISLSNWVIVRGTAIGLGIGFALGVYKFLM